MEIPQIQIHEAKKKLDAEELSVRRYSRSRLVSPGAYSRRDSVCNDGNVQEFLQNTDKEQAVVVYCYHGNSSLGATAFLIENGFKNVASMSGGFEAWRQVYEHEGRIYFEKT